MNDTKLLYVVAIFSLAMAFLFAAAGMRYGSQASSLVPTSLAFTFIGMVAGTVARITSSLTRRIESIENANKKAELHRTTGLATSEQDGSSNRDQRLT
ncbi:MAG: hypothetical protein ABL888_16190 [Pirellulaceae bacterium]